jgi:hypothetical protein
MKIVAMNMGTSTRYVPEDRADYVRREYKAMDMGDYIQVQPVNMHGQPTQGKKGSKDYLDKKVEAIADRFGC